MPTSRDEAGGNQPRALYDPDVVRERDLLRAILELVDHDAPEPFVLEALAQIMALTDATRGYIELAGHTRHEHPWTASLGLDPEATEEARRLISSSIIADALSSGRLVETACATNDARFGAAESVQRNAIEAVLCIPVGSPALGVIYLQAPRGRARFSPSSRPLLELFARHLAPVARRLLAAMTPIVEDPTLPWRTRLGGASELVGKSPALAAALKTASMVAALNVPVLLTGPSGTGKTEIARLIVANSPRKHGPFVELNCAALPEALVESELFGALPGAHSTATRRMVGKVEVAMGGTILLDEVGELPLQAQAKLLQVVNDGTYWPLGATGPSRADVRILAATNVDLDAAVAAGRFRPDLLYRLRVMPLGMPGLDQRRSDIPAIAEALLNEIRARHDLGVLRFTASALAAVVNADWPGNVRELGNMIEAAAIRARVEATTEIDVGHVFPTMANSGAGAVRNWNDLIRDFQRRVLQDALAANGGNVPETAKALGIARSHAYQLVKDLGAKVS